MTETRYVRKPFDIEATQVTQDNMSDVAAWCKGEVLLDGPEVDSVYYVHLDLQNVNDRHTKAFIGDWVTYNGSTFRIYTDRAFRKSFELPGQTRNVFNATAGGVGGSGGRNSIPSDRFKVEGSGNPIINAVGGSGGVAGGNPGGTRGA